MREITTRLKKGARNARWGVCEKDAGILQIKKAG